MKNNKWKILDIANLPSDIMVGDYEFAGVVGTEDTHIISGKISILKILDATEQKGCLFRYRKKETPPPTHEDIMTKWWNIDDSIWCRVIAYNADALSFKHTPVYFIGNGYFGNGMERENYDTLNSVTKDWFIDKRSALIPPGKG